MHDQSFEALRKWAKQELTEISQFPLLDADFLLAEITKVEKSQIPIKVAKQARLSAQQINDFAKVVARRAKGEPIAYIIGHWGFWQYDFIVTQDTLVPRTETETLVETILARWTNEFPLKVLEMGTGTGIISVCLGKERPNWQITATDICQKALLVAKKNAKKLAVKNIEPFQQGSWYNALTKGQYFDLIISNPPYVADKDPHLQAQGVKFEPEKALVGGKDGFDLINEIIVNAPNWLYPGGYIMLESASTQIDAIKKAMAAAGIRYIESIKDLAGKQRVSVGQLSALKD